MPGQPTKTKADITNQLSYKLGLPKSDCAIIVNTMFELLSSFLENGINVKISCFGNFDVRRKNARIGRNPKTMQEALISGRYVVTYKASQKVTDRLAKNSQQLEELID